MTKNIFAGIVATIAFLLIYAASNVAPETSVGYFIGSLILMAAYCFGQYRYGKNYR